MARNAKTIDYLERIRSKNPDVYQKLFKSYRDWKESLNIEQFEEFLHFAWEEKVLNNNARGIAFEEFCFDLLSRIHRDTQTANLFDIIWNENLIIEEFYVFEGNQFKKYQNQKAVDIALVKKEGALIHPILIIGCKGWLSKEWLEGDKEVFDSLRNRYPNVLGYSLCKDLKVSQESIVRGQRTGLKIFDLTKEGEIESLTSDIKKSLKEIIKGNS
ncbi:MAG: hypothetical protein WAX07_00105 [Candidatus Altiarchaeia archaeon]